MSTPKFYLETSVWGSLAPRQPRDRQQIVQKLLRMFDGDRAECNITVIVLAEIMNAPSAEAHRINEYVHRVRPVVHAVSDDIESLAKAYIAASVLPRKRESDALHVAAATCLQLDYLVSWNHRHMTRPMKRVQYEAVNRLHGFLKTPMICNPFEAYDELRHR